MASLVHDISPTLRHSLHQSHNKGLYYGFRDSILSRLCSYVRACACMFVSVCVCTCECLFVCVSVRV